VTTGKNGQNVLPSCNINIYTVFGKKPQNTTFVTYGAKLVQGV